MEEVLRGLCVGNGFKRTFMEAILRGLYDSSSKVTMVWKRF